MLDLYANIFEKKFIACWYLVISNFYSYYRIRNKIDLKICLRSLSFVLFSIYSVYIVFYSDYILPELIEHSFFGSRTIRVFCFETQQISFLANWIGSSTNDDSQLLRKVRTLYLWKLYLRRMFIVRKEIRLHFITCERICGTIGSEWLYIEL